MTGTDRPLQGWQPLQGAYGAGRVTPLLSHKDGHVLTPKVRKALPYTGNKKLITEL